MVGDRWSVIGDRLPITDYRLPDPGLDLLTVVMHELGHLLGYGHSDDPDDLMAPVLSVGRAGGFPTREPLGRAEWGWGTSSLVLHPSSFLSVPSAARDELFSNLSSDGSSWLESQDADQLLVVGAGMNEEAREAKVPRRSRLERYQRELDDWFAELAADEAAADR